MSIRLKSMFMYLRVCILVNNNTKKQWFESNYFFFTLVNIDIKHNLRLVFLLASNSSFACIRAKTFPITVVLSAQT